MSDGGPDESDDPLTVTALAARDGDREATIAFVRATQTEVWRMAASVVGREHADDVTQDVYLRALKALPQFAGRSSVRTWLLSIVRHACADQLRSVMRTRRLGAAVAAQPEPPPVMDTGVGHAAADLLLRLPHEQRIAFALTQVIGLSYAEAAEVEGVPVGTIRSRVARARANLVVAHRAAQAS